MLPMGLLIYFAAVRAFSQYLILPILVGANAKTTIGLRDLTSWQWTNGEPFSIVHPNLNASLNSYDENMHPCVFNFCGIFRTVSLTDLRIFDNCCHNVMPSFACFTKALTWIGQVLRGYKVLNRSSWYLLLYLLKISFHTSTMVNGMTGKFTIMGFRTLSWYIKFKFVIHFCIIPK